MITSINTENSNDYKALFQSACDFLQANAHHLDSGRQASINAMTSITSVQQYFSHLKDLQDLAAFGGKRYLMLPLDEPYFIVNANSREITVPAEFKKNGISVQGDEIAESLIFKINRFFDYADLNAMVVKIQWQNAKGEEGLSDAYVVDDVKNADYLYIMWPITSEITSKAGTIKFSLRFYKLNGDTLMYSFSTKVAAATINSGQDLNLQDTQIANAGGRFEEAIVNSVNTAAETAMTPYFSKNLDEPGDDSHIENADYIGETRLEAYIDETSPVQTLRVQATSQDAGIITYTWYYSDTLVTSYSGGLKYRLTGEDEYIEVPSTVTEADPHKLYYRKEGNDYIPTSFVVQQGLQLYEKTNVYRVRQHNIGYNTATGANQEMPHVVGKYWAVATNTVGGNPATKESIAIVFPSPEKIEFTETGNLLSNSYLNSTGTGSLQVEVSIDDHGAKASYEWEFGDTITGPFYSINDEHAFSAAEREKWSVNETGNILTINGKPGFYQVKATTTRNYDTKSIYSNVSKVTLPLQNPVIVSPLYDQAVSSLYGPATMEVIVTPFTSSLESEGITYQWFTDEGQAVDGATSSTLTVPQGTRMGYYCVVTNHMGWDPVTHTGGDTAETRSADFSVNPILPPTEPQPEPDQGNTQPQPEPTQPTLNATVSKVSAANATTEIPANQDKVSINVTESNGVNLITISGNLSELEDSVSSDPNQPGEHKWLALDINTGLDSLEGLSWNGHALTSAEVAEQTAAANANHLGAGHLVLLVKADELVNESKNVTLGYGNQVVNIQITFESTEG